MFIPNQDAFRRALKFYVSGSRGGAARLAILLLLEREPLNINEISRKLLVDYKTAQHHVRVLEKSGLVTPARKKYGNEYVLSTLLVSDKKLVSELKDMGKSK